ncbi:hypothetical protein SAMN05443144_101266 [Fodinibius roseus]|uniref:Uncharacterized protein n=1 Tax=Fodinibius roseus TaxID=1194090 RepID=A0A1M4TCT1_9BACT|nr:hypothetical protein [Fodinibius roseus]SHE42359.1 hypothetical protein SAMN05443144_101266 [Fodinibius roseus]
MKRSLQSKIGLFLLMLTSIGLTISTLHSHHHLEWNHSSDFTDTGHCLSKDTAVCPIVGYIFEKEVLSASRSGNIFFSVKEIITEENNTIDDASTVVSRGRSPPALI